MLLLIMTLNLLGKTCFPGNSDVRLDDYYSQLGNEFLGLNKTLKNNHEIEVRLTIQQQQQFNTFFGVFANQIHQLITRRVYCNH